MGLPNIYIAFKTAAAAAIQRAAHGVVAIILRDAAAQGGHEILGETQIPEGLGADNQDYIRRAFIGYQNRPRKVELYVLPQDAENLNTALDYMAARQVDYLVGPPDCTEAEAGEIAAWVKAQRAARRIPKAVLPHLAADNEGIINFATEGIVAGGKTYTAAQYCSRMAGLIAGTPLNISCTYAPLSEVTDVERKTTEQLDAAVDAGEFVLFHDGQKVKVGRGVNSFVTTTKDKGAPFQKIKTVEAVDTMSLDLRTSIEDQYIGKYPNSADNKYLLISAILAYLAQMEGEEVLAAGESMVDIDTAKNKTYLMSQGQDVSKLSEQQIKQAATGSNVFLSGKVVLLDAMEDVELDLTV